MYLKRRFNVIESLIHIFATVSVWLVFLKEAFSERLHIILTAAGIVTGLALFILCILNYKIPQKVYFIWAMILLFGVINLLFVGSLQITNFIPMLLLYFPIAIYFFYCGSHNYKWWEINYYVYAIYLIYRMLSSANGYLLFYSVSRNMLSALLLIWLTILYVAFSNAKKKVPFRCIIIFFIGCFIANGRGGIVSAVILLCFWWIINIYNHMKNHHARWLPWTILLLILASYIVVHSHDLFEKYMYRFTEYQSIRTSEARISAWQLYLKQILGNPYDLMFGGNTYKILSVSYLKELNGNLHNSFLSLHAEFGIFVLIYICWRLYCALRKAIKSKNYIFFILMIVCLIRSMTDTLFPAKISDIFLWIFVFYSLSLSENKGKNENLIEGEQNE